MHEDEFLRQDDLKEQDSESHNENLIFLPNLEIKVENDLSKSSSGIFNSIQDSDSLYE